MRTRRHCLALLLLVITVPSRAQTTAPPGPRSTTARSADLNFTILDLTAAKAAIIDDSLDPYFAKLSPAEMTAKTSKPITGDTPAEQIAETKDRYQAAVRTLLPREAKGLRAILSRIQPLLERDYPRFAEQPWSVITVADTLEGGVPHTRGKHIILPQNFVRAFAMIGDESPDVGIQHFAGILVHEQTHVAQRLHPDWFTPLYIDVLHFTRATMIDSDPSIEDIRIVNPDGTICDWVYHLQRAGEDRWIWPRLIMKNPDRPSMSINAIAVDLIKTGDATFQVKLENGTAVTQPLFDLDPYMQVMRSGFNAYHPNEVSADLFATLVVSESLLEKDRHPSMNDFRQWANKTFKP